jgi:hypothetical protein
MPRHARLEVVEFHEKPRAANAMHVMSPAESCTTGDEGVMRQLVRHAARRCEIRAVRRAAIVRNAGRFAVVISVVLLTCGLFMGPRTCCTCGPSRVDTTKMKLKMYAFEAYPSWAIAHPDLVCPRSLQELNEYMGRDDSQDVWGSPMDFRCGPDLPDDAKGVWVRSAGEDRRFDTDDDLVSSR